MICYYILYPVINLNLYISSDILMLISFILACAFSQTTYENFRYHYDKKENPYSKGIIGNIKEVFFSKIPPSMINFRAWVSEDEGPAMGSVEKQLDGGFMSSKEKFDIEIGSKFGKDNGLSVPYIFKNLDYTGIDDNLKRKMGDGDTEIDPISIASGQEPRYSQWTSPVGGKITDDKSSR